MRALLVLPLALALTACLRSTEFQCQTSAQCGTGGVCESTGYCSLPDDTCGRRYSPSAGALANQCVGGSGIDGGVDGPGIDATPDAETCPGFTALGGAPHRYMLVSTAATWGVQVSTCMAAAPAAYLAIPDDSNELAALDMLAGGAAPYWVGISDRGTEGTWLTVNNTPQTFLPWAPNHPVTMPPNNKVDCVHAASAQLTDDTCFVSLPAICECE